MSKYIYVHAGDNNPVPDAEKINISNVNMISNGSSENILCDCLDLFTISERTVLTNELLKKLRVGGTLHLKFINLKLFSKNCYLDRIEEKQLNNIIANVKSLVDDSHLEQILNNSTNFAIKSLVYDGLSENVIIERRA
jgi:hypothetical protein